ncbi:hypothetical protein C2S51_025794 [Perilla frutescens var. frutescens]|nr:hypothetical protein C2S51_025794 [Perilla frutescens var. frutescens]
MALAEARAAWQRTANRCLVQEDAKRAPKLAYCSSVPPSVKQAETEPTSAAGGQDIPSSNSLPFHRSPSYSNLSPNTKWWLQTQPNYGCHRGLMDEKIRSPEGNMENSQIQDSLVDVTRNEDDYEVVSQASHIESLFDNKNFVTCEKKGIKVKEEKLRSIYHLPNFQDPVKIELEEDMEELRDIGIISSEGSKSSGDLYFGSDSSWVGTEKNTPWWRTADTEELAFLVAQRSLDLIENCDLPSPQNVHVKKNLSTDISCLSHSEISTSIPVRKSSGFGGTRDSSPATSAGSSCRNLRMLTEEQLLSSPKYPLRDSPTQERNREIHMQKDDAGKAQLLEALRHSQTRAREAETVAKQVSAEKEHVVKLVFRQAQQLFAYKQWVQLLQLENMYFQLKNNKLLSAATTSPAISPWTVPSNRKMQRGWMKSSGRNRAKRRRPRPRYDVGRYAIVFALGLGLVGAGLLLGWTIGWMLPTWDLLLIPFSQICFTYFLGIAHDLRLFLPAVVRPILDSLETSKPVPPPQLSDVVAAMTGKKRD